MPGVKEEFASSGAAMVEARDRQEHLLVDERVTVPDADGPALITCGGRRITSEAARWMADAWERLATNAEGLNRGRF